MSGMWLRRNSGSSTNHKVVGSRIHVPKCDVINSNVMSSTPLRLEFYIRVEFHILPRSLEPDPDTDSDSGPKTQSHSLSESLCPSQETRCRPRGSPLASPGRV